MFVIQITGGRDFMDSSAIYNTMKPYVEQYGAKHIIVRHGKARGADSLSHMQARRLGVIESNIQARPVEYYGLSWDLDKEGNAAGNLRNIAMLEEEPKPDIVLAFPDANSKGTYNMIEFATERGIKVIENGVEVVPASSIKNTAGTITADSIATDIKFGLEQELAAAMLFADEIWPGSSVARLPEYSDLDFAVMWRGELKAFIEVKARRINVDTYDMTMLPLRKHHIARQISDNLKIPTYAVIVFQDAMVSFHLENEPDEVQFVKRDDRDKGMKHGFYNHSRFTYHMRKGVEHL